MPKKRGFTLVEVIATIAIMALITIIVTPNIISYLNKGKEGQYKTLEAQIITAAKDYYIKNKDEVADNSDRIILSNIKNAIDEEFKKNNKIIDPINSNKCFKDSSYVQITRNLGQQIKFEFKPTTESC